MGGGFHTISLTARNMHAAWAWANPCYFLALRGHAYWHRLGFYTGSILSYVTNGRWLYLEVRVPIRIFSK